MAKPRKTRVRKAPTLRELAATSSTPDKAEKKSGKRGKLHWLVNNPISQILFVPFRLVGKVLRFLMPRYFINSWREIRQVTWPSRRETWRLTGAVFIFAIVFGSLVAGVDKGIDEIFKRVILK